MSLIPCSARKKEKEKVTQGNSSSSSPLFRATQRRKRNICAELLARVRSSCERVVALVYCSSKPAGPLLLLQLPSPSLFNHPPGMLLLLCVAVVVLAEGSSGRSSSLRDGSFPVGGNWGLRGFKSPEKQETLLQFSQLCSLKPACFFVFFLLTPVRICCPVWQTDMDLAKINKKISKTLHSQLFFSAVRRFQNRRGFVFSLYQPETVNFTAQMSHANGHFIGGGS